MKSNTRKVVKTFKQLADSKFLTFGQNVTSSMTDAAAVFPSPVPPLADITTALTNFGGLLLEAASRDKVAVQQKNQTKLVIKQMLSQLADYVNTTTTDPALLVQSGFELNKVPQPIAIAAPTRLELTDGGNAGELTLKFKAVKGAAGYLYQYTADATQPETSWVSTPGTTTRYTFTGLNRGTTYFVRAVAVGANQQVMNSGVVSRVSQ